MKVLIVDDDKSLLDALDQFLKSYGHEVVCAPCAEEGINAKPEAFDFILLDYKMPNHDGAWFMQNAKVSRKTRVLLVTAFVNKDVIKRMFDLGVSGYLIKPFDAEDLLRHLEFFSGSSAENGARQKQAVAG